MNFSCLEVERNGWFVVVVARLAICLLGLSGCDCVVVGVIRGGGYVICVVGRPRYVLSAGLSWQLLSAVLGLSDCDVIGSNWSIDVSNLNCCRINYTRYDLGTGYRSVNVSWLSNGSSLVLRNSLSRVNG